MDIQSGVLAKREMTSRVTIIGTLPPIKGLSPYCQGLVSSLSGSVQIEFIGFKKLYPDLLYPGETVIKGAGSRRPQIENVEIRNILTYYNPLSWVRAGLTAKGEIVHAQWWSYVLAPVYVAILAICRLRKKKILITVHNVEPHATGASSRFLNRVVLHFGDAFVAHTEKNKETLSTTLGIPADRISVIPHGALQPAPIKGISREAARIHLEIPLDKRVVLCFGNIREYKGVDVLLKSMGLVRQEMRDVVLLVAGEPWGKWKSYQQIIRDYGLAHVVIKRLSFIPPSDVEYYFAATDIVVLPYKHFDSQSGVGTLALTFKKALVVTNTGGLPDFVRDKKAIAEPGDVEDLARVILTVLQDEQLLDKLSRDSGEIAEACSWDRVGERTLRLYEGLLS